MEYVADYMIFISSFISEYFYCIQLKERTNSLFNIVCTYVSKNIFESDIVICQRKSLC